jgi:hypothetical protein
MIRHAESANNEVYRNARYIYRGGTDDFDPVGSNHYIDTHRKADPELSLRGYQQADALAGYLVPHLENQSSHPVRIICSPMLRTLLTIKPTLERFQQQSKNQSAVDSQQRQSQPQQFPSGMSATTDKEKKEGNNHNSSSSSCSKVRVIVVAFYFETEGCHLKDVPHPGMTPNQIKDLLKDCVDSVDDDIEFVGFDGSDVGWYAHGAGPETRADSELRAAKYCLWLSEYIDQQLNHDLHHPDLFDAGVVLEGEDQEDEHDKHAIRIRRRRTTLAIGHGDFMSSVLKRLVTGFGQVVEMEGIPHRSAFAHFNTGMTELECFGGGRFLVMGTNHTPHIPPHRYGELRSGGTLRDGWSYLVPPVLDVQVEVIFSDDDLDNHVREQTTALRALYTSSADALLQGGPAITTEQQGNQMTESVDGDDALEVDEDEQPKNNQTHFIVRRGLQVVGVATYSEDTGQLTDVAIRPSAATTFRAGGGGDHPGDDDCNEGLNCAETLLRAVKTHARKMGRSESLIVHPRSEESFALFIKMGFSELNRDDLQRVADPGKQVLTSML